MDKLEKAILATISYFDIHKYPLTAMEIFRWLNVGLDQDSPQCSLGEIMCKLDNSVGLTGLVSSKNGYYFLAGRDTLIGERQRKHVLTAHKGMVAQRVAKIFSHLPFIEMAAACNNFGFNALDEKSDIDFFIIARPGRIYLARLISVLVTVLLRIRPKINDKKDKICLSFYVCSGRLDLTDVKIGETDIYLTYWLASLHPFFGFKTYCDLISANANILGGLKNFYSYNPCFRRRINRHFGFRDGVEKFLSGKFGDFLEKFAKKMQMKKIFKKLKLFDGEATGIIVNDEMLKFHDNDNRRFYADEFNKRMNTKYEASQSTL